MNFILKLKEKIKIAIVKLYNEVEEPKQLLIVLIILFIALVAVILFG